MKNFSFRRVAGALVLLSVVSFGATVIITGVSICSTVGSCAAAVTLSHLDAPQAAIPSTAIGQSTPSTVSPALNDFTLSPITVELVSFYALLLAIIILVVMEVYRPKFVHKLFA